MTRFTIIAAWLLATGLTTVVAWQVVGAADDQITTAPLTPVVAVTAPGSETSEPSGEATTPDGLTVTTETTGATTVSTTPSSTTSTTLTGIPATTTAVSDGGTVTVTGTEPRAELVAVVAAPGWTYEVTADDGERVEVRFENASGDDVRVRVEWENGRLVADIDN